MTRSLLVAAIAATVADAVAYVALIATGLVAEGNPIVSSMPAPLALALKAALVVGLVALWIELAGHRHTRLLNVVLLIATVTGLIGATSTVLSA